MAKRWRSGWWSICMRQWRFWVVRWSRRPWRWRLLSLTWPWMAGASISSLCSTVACTRASSDWKPACGTLWEPSPIACQGGVSRWRARLASRSWRVLASACSGVSFGLRREAALPGDDGRACFLAGAAAEVPRGAAVRAEDEDVVAPRVAGVLAAVVLVVVASVACLAGRLRGVDAADARGAVAALRAVAVLAGALDALADLRAVAAADAVLSAALDVAVVLRVVAALPPAPDAAVLRALGVVDPPALAVLRAFVDWAALVALRAAVFLRATPVAGDAARLRVLVLRALVLRMAIGSSIDIAARRGRFPLPRIVCAAGERTPLSRAMDAAGAGGTRARAAARAAVRTPRRRPRPTGGPGG